MNVKTCFSFFGQSDVLKLFFNCFEHVENKFLECFVEKFIICWIIKTFRAKMTAATLIIQNMQVNFNIMTNYENYSRKTIRSERSPPF